MMEENNTCPSALSIRIQVRRAARISISASSTGADGATSGSIALTSTGTSKFWSDATAGGRFVAGVSAAGFCVVLLVVLGALIEGDTGVALGDGAVAIAGARLDGARIPEVD